MMNFNDVIEPNEPLLVYGKPGTSMGSKGFSNKFGKQNTKTGRKGEVIVFDKLRNPDTGWMREDIPLFCSLIIPGKNADIDFAMVMGNKVLLVDAKLYRQDGGFFWNFGDSPVMRRNLSRYTSTSGNNVTLSRSAIMAKDIISKKMPGYDVEAIVVFTTDPKNPHAKMPNTSFLTYPGGIKAYNDAGAKRFIRRYFRGQKRTAATYNGEVALKKLVQ